MAKSEAVNKSTSGKEFDTFDGFCKQYSEARKEARNLLNLVVQGQIGPIPAAERSAAVLNHLYQCEHFAARWIDNFNGGFEQDLPPDFERAECTRAITDMHSLEAAVHLFQAELWRAIGDFGSSIDCARAASKALRSASYYLHEIEGIRLRRWISVIKRRLFGYKSIGIEDLRIQYHELRSILIEYQNIVLRPGRIAKVNALRGEIAEVNQSVIRVVRDLYLRGISAAQEYGAPYLASILVKVLTLEMELVQSASRHATRQAFASLHLLAAHLHWGISLVATKSQPLLAVKHEHYARRSLRQSRADRRRSIELLFTGVFRTLIGTQKHDVLPEWRTLLPKGLEFRRMFVHLQRHLVT